MSSPAGPEHDRLTKLEELHTFTERSVDELSDQLADMHSKLTQMLDRITRLESRISVLRDQPSDNTPSDNIASDNLSH